MEKFFADVQDGLPGTFLGSDGKTTSSDAIGRRRVFNFWHSVASLRRAAFGADGSITLHKLPIGLIEAGQIGFLVESRLEDVNPKLAGDQSSTHQFGSGACYDPEARELFALYPSEPDFFYCWEFLLATAHYLDKHPDALVLERPPAAKPVVNIAAAKLTSAAKDSDGILAIIDELTG